jgi:hypothetical protein
MPVPADPLTNQPSHSSLGTHPLLAQIPLTVSPFVSLPSAATLPYTYKPMPSSLPPSSTGIGVTGSGITAAATTEADGGNNSSSNGAPPPPAPADQKPRYVVSGSGGHAAHPDDIMASCAALQAHVARMQADAERELRALDDRIRARELAEKRRVAPGWLDSDARLLEPEQRQQASQHQLQHQQHIVSPADSDAGAGDYRGGAGSVSPPLAGPGAAAAGVLTGQFAEMSIADRAGASEMAVDVDRGAELDRAFGAIW